MTDPGLNEPLHGHGPSADAVARKIVMHARTVNVLTGNFIIPLSTRLETLVDLDASARRIGHEGDGRILTAGPLAHDPHRGELLAILVYISHIESRVIERPAARRGRRRVDAREVAKNARTISLIMAARLT